MATPASPTVAAPRRAKPHTDRAAAALSVGFVTLFLSVFVALPIAALMWTATSEGSQTFWDAATSPQAVAALKLTLLASLGVSLLNAAARNRHGLGARPRQLPGQGGRQRASSTCPSRCRPSSPG